MSDWGIGFILFGEWVYARHSVFYRQLTQSLDLASRRLGQLIDELNPTRPLIVRHLLSTVLNQFIR